MPTCKTFTGKKFLYEGSLDGDLVLCFATKQTIKEELINFIKEQIRIRGRIKMGACMDNPPPNSLGYLAKQRGLSPRYLSHILPLLEERKFLSHTFEGNAVWVTYTKDY